MASRESIYTIPINEIFEEPHSCPICHMRNVLEERCIDFIMGAAMMEPDIRMETNEKGFCKTHFDQMLKKKNRLSLALMLQSRIKEVKKRVYDNSSKDAFKKSDEIMSDCYVCSRVNDAMDKMIDNCIVMFSKDREFRELFKKSEGLCIEHYSLLLKKAKAKLSKRDYADFFEASKELSYKAIETLEKDVDHFCSMFDYRNSGEDADWGNSRDSIERAIKFFKTREPK